MPGRPKNAQNYASITYKSLIIIIKLLKGRGGFICLFEVKPPLEVLQWLLWRQGVKQWFPWKPSYFCRVEALVYIKVLPVGKSQTKYHISPYIY